MNTGQLVLLVVGLMLLWVASVATAYNLGGRDEARRQLTDQRRRRAS